MSFFGFILQSILGTTCQLRLVMLQGLLIHTSSNLLRKMGMLFDSVHKIEQQFGSYHPELVMKLIGIYFTSLYGSSLWELYLRKFQNLVRSWNTVTKLVWKLPHATHTILLESLSSSSVLEGRYLDFLESLDKSSKPFQTTSLFMLLWSIISYWMQCRHAIDSIAEAWFIKFSL